MQRYQDRAKADLEVAFKLNGKVIQAYLLAMHIGSFDGPSAADEALVRNALKIYPDSYMIRRLHIVSLKPRWGGSHARMESFARESLPTRKGIR